MICILETPCQIEVQKGQKLVWEMFSEIDQMTR
jgi:hypothetical protein